MGTEGRRGRGQWKLVAARLGCLQTVGRTRMGNPQLLHFGVPEPPSNMVTEVTREVPWTRRTERRQAGQSLLPLTHKKEAATRVGRA
jgi:hypothetical protein